MVSWQEGHEVREGDGFSTRVKEVLGDVQHWDEMSFSLSLALNRHPTHADVGTHLLANFWVIRLAGPPVVAVFYEVNEAERLVTYTGSERPF